MLSNFFLSAGTRALVTSLLLTVVFAIGTASGFYLYPRLMMGADLGHQDHDHEFEVHSTGHGELDDEHDGEHDDEHGDHEHEDEEEHVALTKQAFENLELKMGKVLRGDFWKTLLVPARVVEIPGQSDLSISAPVTGIVEQVNILPGQTLIPGEPLFSIRLTDQNLIDAQSKLLESLTRQEVANQELARLKPLVKSGAVMGNKVRELEYELKRLIAQQSTLLQEIRSRGLPETMIGELSKDRKLASILNVFPPSFILETDTSPGGSTGFSVENLLIHPGASVSRGDPLCSVAYHSTLYLEGTAFEDDLKVLEEIADKGWKVTVETHSHGHRHGHEQSEGLKLELLRVDNHVDLETQTVKFYVELPNQVTRTRQSEGRLFEQWRFRPGQQLHLRLPVARWENQLTLPVDAVVVDGPNAIVFVEHHHETEGGETTDHDEHEHDHDFFIELEPVPVRLLHRDDKTIVIADDGQVSGDSDIALNNAYKLYLAMKMQAGGGGGHHHHHDH